MQAFLAILWRDVYVTAKEFWVLLVQVALTPLFMLFIFAKVLVSQGSVSASYGHDLLLPGIIALSAFLTSLQSVAFPLVMEFGWTREIEDRLLAPLPTDWVTVEKLLIATLRGFAASLVMYPIGALVLGTAPWHPARLPRLLLAVLLGAWVGAGIGITFGSLVPPQDQHHVRAHPHAADAHRRDAVRLAAAERHALVPGDHRHQPADLPSAEPSVRRGVLFRSAVGEGRPGGDRGGEGRREIPAVNDNDLRQPEPSRHRAQLP